MASSSSNMRGSRRRKFKSEINVVPYIDVMLVLLIIFMAVPPTNTPNEINLPNAQKSTQPPDDYILVSIKPTGSLSVGIHGKTPATPTDVPDRAAAVRELREVHAAHPDYPVMIAGDKEAKYDDVIQLISEAKKLGITRVGLATK